MRSLKPWLVLLTLGCACTSASSDAMRRDVVTVRNGDVELRAVLWRRGGHGQQSATFDRDQEWYKRETDLLGPLFARHGYVFLCPFRRGAGLSAGRGFLRSQREVDARRIPLVGHSFGGSLTLFLAERDSSIRAVVSFAAAAASWERSPELQARLLRAAGTIAPPVFFIHAANDDSVTPGKLLAAERERAGNPYRLEIYPPFGKSAFEGHNFIDLDVSAWEQDVFAFVRESRR